MSQATTATAGQEAMILRPYQVQAVAAVYDHLRTRDDNPCVVIPTAGGKTPLMATICRDAVQMWDGRVLILAHVKELLEQAVDKLHTMAPDLWHQIGVYSAGLKSRDTDHPIIVAGIQSVYRKACDLGRFDLILIDECHLIPPDGEGMYQTFLADAKVINPNVRLVGLTATPYRMTTGTICAPGGLLNHVCYEAGVRELIVQGYLCPLKSKAGQRKADFDSLHLRGGEFIAGEVENLMDDDVLVGSACHEIIEHTKDRHAVLIFAAGVRHAQHVQRVITGLGHECGLVCGETLPFDRADTLDRFRHGDLKFLVNVNVLTTGFDAPNVDCVVLLRPTNSPGLYYQMCLDMETEVLTSKGWARCHEVRVGDTVGAFDMESGHVVWCAAQNKVHRQLAPGESMYGIQSPHLDVRVTDHHTMIYRGRSRTCKRWRKGEARGLSRYSDSYRIPIAGSNDGPGLPLSDDEIRFLGWAMTDGHYNPHNNAVVICQSAASPHNKAIVSMLEGCGFGYRVYRRARTGKTAGYADAVQYVVPYGKPRGVNAGKRGWRHLSKYFWNTIAESMEDISHCQLQIMLDAMNLADGSKPRNLSWTPRTQHIAIGPHQFLADQLQSLLIRRGFRCNISRQRTKSPWQNDCPRDLFILHVRPQTTATVGGVNTRSNAVVKRRCALKPVRYSPHETVWCLSTDHGTLVTRRNGKVAIVGNCGRGFRLHPSKDNCLVLDFGGNILRHGPVDALQIKDPSRGGGEAPAKECPKCQALIHAAYGVCPECGYVFPPPKREQHDRQATTAGVLSGEVTETEHEVQDVFYSAHTKRDAPEGHPRTLRVDYRLGFNEYQSEWVCIEHPPGSYARQKAEAWWRSRSHEPCPTSVDEAVAIAEDGGVAVTRAITVRHVTGEKYDRIVKHELGPIPPRRDGSDERGAVDLPDTDTVLIPDDQIPF